MVRFRWGRYLTDVHVGFSPSKPRICNTQIFLWGRRLGELWAISVRSAWHSTRGNVNLRHPWKCLITSLAVLPLSSHRPWMWIRLIISITECLLTLLRGVAVPGKTQLCSIEKKPLIVFALLDFETLKHLLLWHLRHVIILPCHFTVLFPVAEFPFLLIDWNNLMLSVENLHIVSFTNEGSIREWALIDTAF